MKKFILILGLLAAAVSFNRADAQNINISINIGSQPSWGPTGYDYVDYYYIPEIDVYYNVNLSLFYYRTNGYWVSAGYLPYRYHSYDFYNMYKVVINVQNPWMYNNNHRRLYANYRSYKPQPVIRYSTDNRYKNSRKNDIRWTASDSRTSVRETRVSNSNSGGRTSNSTTGSRVSTNQRTSTRPVNNARPATTQTSRANNTAQNRPATGSRQTNTPARTTTSATNSRVSQTGRTNSGSSARVSSSARTSSNNSSAARTSSSSSRGSRR